VRICTTWLHEESEGSHIPCDQVRTTTVELGEVSDHDALVKALEQHGARNIQKVSGSHYFEMQGQQCSLTGGRITSRGYNELKLDVNSVKRAYSREVVTKQAQKAGWKVRFTADNKAVATKRRFGG
jgi:hypothetical protein